MHGRVLVESALRLVRHPEGRGAATIGVLDQLRHTLLKIRSKFANSASAQNTQIQLPPLLLLLSLNMLMFLLLPQLLILLFLPLFCLDSALVALT